MLELAVSEGDEERFGLVDRQAILPEASYECALFRDVLGTFRDVPPNYLKFGFAIGHLSRTA